VCGVDCKYTHVRITSRC